MIKAKQLFNLEYLEELNAKDFTSQVINLYIKDTDTDLEKMRMAFDGCDVNTVYQMAHKLKGSTGMLQANLLSAVLAQTEATAMAGIKTSQLEALVQTARYEFEQLKPALELRLKEINLH